MPKNTHSANELVVDPDTGYPVPDYFAANWAYSPPLESSSMPCRD